MLFSINRPNSHGVKDKNMHAVERCTQLAMSSMNAALPVLLLKCFSYIPLETNDKYFRQSPYVHSL